MRDIHRLERLALDAIEQTSDPTLADVRAFVRARRRLWFWTEVGLIVALFRLEGSGRIEARRKVEHGKVRWIYRRRGEDGGVGQPCQACATVGTGAPCH
jgi:hypothetical protein